MFEQRFDVRFYETDALKHVSNTVLVGWFESARMPIFKIFNPSLDLDNWPLILASYSVNFLQQIYLGEPIMIQTSIERLGNSSFDVRQELFQSQQHKASGLTTLVHFDYQQQKSATIPPHVRSQLAVHSHQST